MIYITQLIYIIDGEENTFHEFEDTALPIIKKHNGRLELRIRPNETSIIHSEKEPPYEIHLVSFDSEEDFERFLLDEERNRFLHLKNSSIKTTLLIKGRA